MIRQYIHIVHTLFLCVCVFVCVCAFFLLLLLFTLWNESVSSSWKISPPVQSYSSQTTYMTGVFIYSLGDILCKYKKNPYISFTSFCLFKCWHIIYNIVLYHSIHLVKYLDHFISIFKDLSEITSLPMTSLFLSFITVWLYLYFWFLLLDKISLVLLFFNEPAFGFFKINTIFIF